MLKTLSYSLMAGGMLAMVGWMMNQAASVKAGTGSPGTPRIAQETDLDHQDWNDQTENLIAWVDEVGLDDPTYRSDWLDLDFTSQIESMKTENVAYALVPGLSQAQVRDLLGDPIEANSKMQRWEYETITVTFNEEGSVQGWLVMADTNPVQQSMRNVMAPLGVPQKQVKVAEAPRKWVIPAPYISGGGGGSRSATSSGGSSYRRPLDRVLDRPYTTSPHANNRYRKPAYLRNMFQRSQRTSRDRERNERYRRSYRY